MSSPNIPVAQPFEVGFEFQVQVGVTASSITDTQNNRSEARKVDMLHHTHFDGLDFKPLPTTASFEGTVSGVAEALDEHARSDPAKLVLDGLIADVDSPLRDLQAANERANTRNFKAGLLDGALASAGLIGTTGGIYAENVPLTIGSFVVCMGGLLDTIRRSMTIGNPEEGQEGAVQRLMDASKAKVLSSLITRSIERSKEEPEESDSAAEEPLSQE